MPRTHGVPAEFVNRCGARLAWSARHQRNRIRSVAAKVRGAAKCVPLSPFHTMRPATSRWRPPAKTFGCAALRIHRIQ